MLNTVYGRLGGISRTAKPWGSVGVLFSGWEELQLSGFVVVLKKAAPYRSWADPAAENVCVVEEGSGELVFNEKKHMMRKGFAFKVFPGQEPLIVPDKKLVLLSVQMPAGKAAVEALREIKVVNPDDVPAKVYEYETLGQEIVTCDYTPGIGLLKFTFPIDKIPIHRHPFSGRLIRPLSGKGYTFLDPDLYEMDKDTFILFPKGTVHTNGPLPGYVYQIWAFQLPWVDPRIDEENIAGADEFVVYHESTPPKPLWKKKEDFLRMIRKLGEKGGP